MSRERVLAHRLVELFPLFHVSLDDIDDEGERDQCGEVVCYRGLLAWIRRPEKIVEKNTNRNQSIADLAAQEHGTDPKGQNVEIPQRHTRGYKVGVGNRANRPEDQHHG